MSRSHDFAAIVRSLQLIVQSGLKLQESNFKLIWENSSVRVLAEDYFKKANQPNNVKIKNTNTNTEVANLLMESYERCYTVLKSIAIYASHDASIKVAGDTNSKEKNVNIYKTTSLKKLEETPIQEKDEFRIKLSPSDWELLKKLDMEHREKIKQNEKKVQTEKVKIVPDEPNEQKIVDVDKLSVRPNPKSIQTLSTSSKQRTVPSSRISRMASFGSLAAGLGVGTAAEFVRRTLGVGSSDQTIFMSQANLDRIVDTLCKVRGAALKLGQILSIQDDSVVNSELATALERVRKSADFMPNWQVEQVMISELGTNWRAKFQEFHEKPFAAASIGQVHYARDNDGDEVAIKIQYPGVGRGINSDIDNLVGIMNLWNLFPKGMFLENLMTVAKRELAWEVDYKREAECTRKFKELLTPYPEFYVPSVKDDLSTTQVFTTELLDGIPVDQCFDMDVEDKHFIASKLMDLCLLEILEFRYMQTDPNWANFLYNPKKKQLLLLDFGASREYSKEFMNIYVKILKAACDSNREAILEYSKELGFLTGYESKIMEDAHVDAVLILGEVFRCEGEYNFGAQDMTQRIQNLVPTMMNHRLCPPPEEIYSLHRKLSGVFLLCAKLKVPVSCREKFLNLYDKYLLTH